MLSYQHAYHAGNFADVLKHWCLQLCLDSLCRKPAPWTAYDTHAGDGDYALTQGKAALKAEWRQGVARVWQQREQAPEALHSWLEAVAAQNAGAELSDYPGSPALMAHALREKDHAVLCELHPQAFPALQEAFKRDAQVKCHLRDGFEGVMTQLPPPSGRGLILIDPSYELKADYRRIPDWVQKALKRWRQAQILIWYPILEGDPQKVLIDGLCQDQGWNTGLSWLRVELERLPARGETRQGLLGSGMLVVNPPWQLDEQIQAGLGWLAETLKCKAAIAKKLN
ncbi:MAG: 23S rRNA (adenine(2030)-N(6))-methyltransferase RlmJ [Hahellaceae bacterium]|nr:23S rRNA (adenine(2030)-N(6))-methyltransferase RlmJ [Hahellaceae bacterium]